ncbi:helix-turn-helix domain-containing protein [Paramaledivibacter caminithermalis]|jgi:transcriptional regulator with XRE-family HTH domain|uniref:Helix-turn-helix domain-containing protein n=1 Tax=Paramaledivibacter caminithermalis (strain DSM 15212 / CIP 107654 / DViRD3) TaxID=1121301 RepID=A0A1M6PRB2_PARC5|nr:helix-turn-helix transcriptional regulator [Paramaledivibacter caminithermalis]SHK10490.1 Helix-turn-helix domain-containing protein [Paramaledivibacter caminithermalis DSM 15212]
MVIDIGKAIKKLRISKKLTLKDLSDRTGLSTGFLSQLERGLTTIAIDSLENVANALDVDLSYFILSKDNKKE